MPLTLYWLAFGMFALGTESLLVAGLLPAIAGEYGITLSAAGHLLTFFAITYAVGAPIMATVTARFDRRKVLLVSLGVFTLSNTAAAFTTNYEILLALRVCMAIFACLYAPSAMALGNALAPPDKRGRAISIIAAGLTVASAFGVPFGTQIGNMFGWRASFLAVAGLGLIAFVAVFVGIKRTPPPPALSLRARLLPLTLPIVRYGLAVTVVWSTGIFVLFAYLASYFADLGISGGAYAGVLLLFGCSAFVGNLFGGWSTDKLGTMPTMRNALLMAIPVLLAFSLVPYFPSVAWIAVPLVALWSPTGYSLWPARQSEMIAMAPESAALLLGLNTSAFYTGMAAGSAIGSLVVAHQPPSSLGFVAALIEAAALGLLAMEWRKGRKRLTAA
ncbi:MAG TPA: MFS transporter [Alphaproteobacteria bacterium]|nr:MFS transporter [Alphaproteobacteria bacterium]